MKFSAFAAFGIGFVLNASLAHATILPKNNLHLQDRVDKFKDIDEALFNKITDEIVAKYVPVAKAHGANLVARKHWADPTVNAYAQQVGKDWFIDMFGGLARREEVTPDGYALVVCHELGHHFGGYWFKGERWASAEGQSDYFATQACARVAWKDQKARNAGFRLDVNPVVKEKCDAAWKSREDQDLCYRVAKGGESLAVLLGALGKEPVPKFDTPDPKQVAKTYDWHPAAQCRLDTYFYGALCTKNFDMNVIPGKNHPEGQGSVKAEGIAAANSCMAAQGFKLGARPRCWFKPLVENLGLIMSADSIKETEGNNNGVFEPGESAQVSFKLQNGLRLPSHNVVGRVSSRTPGIQIVQGQSSFPDIAPGRAVSNGQALVVKADPSVPCGTRFELNLQARNQAGSMDITRSYTLGHVTSALMGERNVESAISAAGVASVIEARNAGTVNLVAVKVDIKHPRPGDVRVSLVLPNGQTRLLRERVPASGDAIRETFQIAVPRMPAKGLWRLVVSDSSRGNLGRLDRWELTGVSAVCVAPNVRR